MFAPKHMLGVLSAALAAGSGCVPLDQLPHMLPRYCLCLALNQELEHLRPCFGDALSCPLMGRFSSCVQAVGKHILQNISRAGC